ncbi:MAG: helix-turn-helix domain-containing protein [Clostridia bacterium]|nr:helix-turn-helix domain-containing protein [Clostridia bacterium]
MINYHVVLADDDVSITKGLCDILKTHFPDRFILHCASSGVELRALLCRVPAALVITDIKMPGLTGLDCLRFIREQRLACEVILLSGYDDYALIRQAFRLNVADYMLKPVHIESLVRLVSELLPRLEGRVFAPARDDSPQPLAVQAAPYFDIPVAEPLSEDALCEALERFVRAVQCMDADGAEKALSDFFTGNDGSILDEQATKNMLIRHVYLLMERIPAMIHIIAENKLTHYDAVSSIKNLPTLSQLHKRLSDTFRHNVGMLQQNTEKRDQHLVAQAKAYIAEHYMENPSLEDVAGMLHITPGYFSTLFRQLSGVTFREYLRKERIEQAQRLILEGSCRLYEIAERVGYQNTSHFNRAFKAVTGVTPSIWAVHHKARIR